jgi:hypothetical protein
LSRNLPAAKRLQQSKYVFISYWKEKEIQFAAFNANFLSELTSVKLYEKKQKTQTTLSSMYRQPLLTAHTLSIPSSCIIFDTQHRPIPKCRLCYSFRIST